MGGYFRPLPLKGSQSAQTEGNLGDVKKYFSFFWQSNESCIQAEISVRGFKLFFIELPGLPQES